MRIGIIAEGRGDLAVIANLLKGRLGLDLEHIQFLRPEYALDETDLHDLSEEKRSNWEFVKKECQAFSLIDDFLISPLDEEKLVVVHIDADQCEHPNYGVVRPKRQPGREHAVELHGLIVERLEEWLAGRGMGRIRYAIAVEQTDAWVLTLYVQTETSAPRDPKKALEKELNKPNRFSAKERKRLFNLKTYARYDELSRPFRKRRELEKAIQRNQSLRLFIESLPVGSNESS